MLEAIKTPLVLVGRLLIALMFVQSGYEKLTDLTGTAGYIASGGLPNSTALAALTGIFELVAGLAIAIGFKARGAALHEEHGDRRRPARADRARRRACQHRLSSSPDRVGTTSGASMGPARTTRS